MRIAAAVLLSLFMALALAQWGAQAQSDAIRQSMEQTRANTAQLLTLEARIQAIQSLQTEVAVLREMVTTLKTQFGAGIVMFLGFVAWLAQSYWAAVRRHSKL
jgi:uncharacterized membrane protein (UPF0182 family)